MRVSYYVARIGVRTLVLLVLSFPLKNIGGCASNCLILFIFQISVSHEPLMYTENNCLVVSKPLSHMVSWPPPGPPLETGTITRPNLRRHHARSRGRKQANTTKFIVAGAAKVAGVVVKVLYFQIIFHYCIFHVFNPRQFLVLALLLL